MHAVHENTALRRIVYSEYLQLNMPVQLEESPHFKYQ